MTKNQTGWKLVPLEPTPEIIAGAAIASWPAASAEDIELARMAAPLVLMKLDLAPGSSVGLVAAMLATMAPAYRAMLAAAPTAPVDYALMPIEPTGPMKDVGASVIPVSAASTWVAGDVWRAMAKHATKYETATLPSQRAASALAVPENVREFVEAVAGPMATYIDRETDEHCCAGCNCAEVYVGFGQPYREAHTDDCIVLRARAILTQQAAPEAPASAQPVAAAPAGWKLVPLEPTDRMTAIGQDLRYQSINSIGEIYRQMIAAAPAAPVAQAFPERDVSKPAEQQGMFRKFEVRRVDGSDQPGGKHYGCRYYVLDLDHDQHAPAAMRAYAAACQATHPPLAADIVAEFGAPVAQATTASAAPAARAKLTDEEIQTIWQTMPGGPAGWLKSFGYLQFARAVEEWIIENNGSLVATSASSVEDAGRYNTVRKMLSECMFDHIKLEGESPELIDAWVDAAKAAAQGGAK